MAAAGACRTRAYSPAAHLADTRASAVSAGIFEIGSFQRSGDFAAIDAGKQQRSSAFENGQWRTAEQIGEAHVDDFLTAANGEREAGIWIKLNAKTWCPAIATEPSEHALKDGGASRELSHLAPKEVRGHQVLIFSAHRRRGDFFLGRFRFFQCAARAFNRIVETVFVDFFLWGFGPLVKKIQKLF